MRASHRVHPFVRRRTVLHNEFLTSIVRLHRPRDAIANDRLPMLNHFDIAKQNAPGPLCHASFDCASSKRGRQQELHTPD